MFILGLVGSPRKGGNTDILVETVLEASRSVGRRAEKVYLYDAGIAPCLDCRACKTEAHQCAQLDGMRDLYPRLAAADVLVFGTPVYFCGPSGTMKNCLDRLRVCFAAGTLRGKRALVATVAKDGPGEASLVVEMFRRSFAFLGITFAGQVLGTGYDRGDILRDEAALAEAQALGRGIAP